MATTKYIRNISTFSGVLICKVSVGGIKKKFHIRALRMAATRTGNISKSMAETETTSKRIKATT